jgi:hypothetical protein
MTTRENTREIVRRGVSELHHGANIRSDLGTDEELRTLGESLRKGQDTPLLILADGTAVDGHRRLEAARRAGIEELDCIVVPPGTSPRLIQWRCAVHKKDVSAHDKAVAVRDTKADHPEMTNRQLAELLDIDPALVTKYLSLWDCSPEVQERARAGQLGINDWYALRPSREPASNDSTAAAPGRNPGPRHGSGNGKSSRPARIKIPVASGAATGAVAFDLPAGGDLAATEALLKEAEKALRLPRLRITPARDDAPGAVTVAREASDARAEALLKEALRLVQDARSRKLTLKTALVEWRDNAEAAHAAKANPACPEPAAPELTPAVAGA